MPGIRESIKNLLRNEFYHNIFSLFSGMFLARLFPAVFAVIIVRLYSPEHFGLFVLYLTIASALSIATTGKYENAIILAVSVEERKHIFGLSQKINITVNVLIFIVLILVALLSGIKDKKSLFMLLLIPFYAFFLGSIQLLRNIFISYKRFKTLSALEIFRAVITGVLQCLLFIFPGFGLFLGAVISQGIIYYWYARNLPEHALTGQIRFSPEEKEVAKRYIDFPRYSIASEVFNFISSQLPVFLIKPFFGSTMLGLYAFPHRYISVPIQLVSVSISRVYIQKAQSLKHQIPELGSLTFSLFKKQFLAGIIPFALMGLWGGPLFRFIFGPEWEFSGYLAQLISPWLFMVMLSSPLTSIFIVFEKQKFSMKYNVFLLATRLFSLLIGGWILKDITWAIALYSLTGFSFFAGLGIYALKLAGVNLFQVAAFVIKTLSLILLPLILLKLWF